MNKNKKFKLASYEIHQLIVGYGACVATDKITVEGERINYMYCEAGINDVDSGWRFFSGTEDQAYIDDYHNSGFYNMNTIANYDPAIIPYLNFPVGSHLERIGGTDHFEVVASQKPDL